MLLATEKHLQGGRAGLQKGAEAACVALGKDCSRSSRAGLGHFAPESRTHSSFFNSMAVVIIQQQPQPGAQ